jgi:hypothetical protein
MLPKYSGNYFAIVETVKFSESTGNASLVTEKHKVSEMFGQCFPSDAEKKKSSEILRELFPDGRDSDILRNVREMFL